MQKSPRSIFQKLHQREYLILIVICLVFIAAILVYPATKKSNLDPVQLAGEINKTCIHDSSDRCIKNLLASFAKNHKFEQSKAVLDQLQKINSKLLYCHTYAHVISIAEVEKDPDNWFNIFSYIPDSECSYGYFHGVIEGKYKFDQNFLVNQQLIDKICLGNAMKDLKSQRSCSHAFGHILLVQNRGQVLPSLEVCQKINPKISDICFQGVFMENIQKDNLSEHGISDREVWDKSFYDQQIKLCNAFSEPQLTECWRSMSPIILSITANPEEAVEICRSAPTYNAIRACSREVNGYYFIYLVTNGHALTQDLCYSFNKDQKDYRNCIRDTINYVLLTSMHLKFELQNQFCRQLKNELIQFCQVTAESFAAHNN